MISSFLQNSTFSSAINQANNKVAQPQKEVRSESLETKKTQNDRATSKVDSIKEAIKNGSYKIDLRATAEKVAQELLR
ncbi:MAG: flagellar biosynthesis anti-sigma factor FlgM [Helicobacter sp.]|nr:flagellar biosynthesis anti-sigma factor FlgM [Helicobacteraceae bacterium]MDY3113111.1 flagellar biosynthesis anti-sigma factor FlgM [Helicobacter sp.]